MSPWSAMPQVHDPVKQGLITYSVRLAREKVTVAHVGEGRTFNNLAVPDAVAQC